MRYEYQVTQVNKDFIARREDDESVSRFFMDIMNHYAAYGWDFQRMDTVQLYRPPGCLGSFLGHEGTWVNKHIMTFRREIGEER